MTLQEIGQLQKDTWASMKAQLVLLSLSDDVKASIEYIDLMALQYVIANLDWSKANQFLQSYIQAGNTQKIIELIKTLVEWFEDVDED